MSVQTSPYLFVLVILRGQSNVSAETTIHWESGV